MEHFYEKITGWFDFQDIYRTAVNSAVDGAHFVEIGAFLGKSTSFMIVEIVNSGKKIRFDVVDNFEGSSEHKDFEVIKEGKLFENFLKNTYPNWKYFNIIKKDSHIASELYANNSLDFVYIDGAHEYDAISADIHYWFPKVKPRGVIAGHDINYPSVGRAVHEFFVKRNCDKITDFPESWCFIK